MLRLKKGAARITLLFLFLVSAGLIYAIKFHPQIQHTHSDKVTLRVGILPSGDANALIEEASPLFRYISKELNVAYELIIPENYAEATQIFQQRKIDVAHLGGAGFLKVHQESDAIPLAMSDHATHFQTAFIISGRSTAKDIQELKGKRFCFGTKLSSTGHIMARRDLEEKGINPETFFNSVSYTNSHHASVLQIINGHADICAVNNDIVNTMFQNDQLSSQQVRVLWKSKPFHDDVWVAQRHLDEKFIQQLQKLLLELNYGNLEHREILDKFASKAFVPIDLSNFEETEIYAQKYNVF